MKNTCPKCDTAYNVSASVVGRKFTCKNCGTPVVVTADGLDYQNPPSAAPAAAPVADAGGAAFDFDAPAAEVEDRKPAKAAKPAKPAKSRPRDDEEANEDEGDGLPSPRRRKPGGGAGLAGVLRLVGMVTWGLLLLTVTGGGCLFVLLTGKADNAIQQASIGAIFSTVFIGLYVGARCIEKIVTAVERTQQKQPVEEHRPPTP